MGGRHPRPIGGHEKSKETTALSIVHCGTRSTGFQPVIHGQDGRATPQSTIDGALRRPMHPVNGYALSMRLPGRAYWVPSRRDQRRRTSVMTPRKINEPIRPATTSWRLIEIWLSTPMLIRRILNRNPPIKAPTSPMARFSSRRTPAFAV